MKFCWIIFAYDRVLNPTRNSFQHGRHDSVVQYREPPEDAEKCRACFPSVIEALTLQFTSDYVVGPVPARR